jgi:hypothetical protein
MTQSPEDKYHLDKWWLFQELRSEFLVSDPSNISTVFHLREHDAPNETTQSRLLEQLAGQNIIELEKIDDSSYKVVFMHGFVKAYDAMYLWFKNYSDVTGLGSVYGSSVAPDASEHIVVRLSKEGRGLWLIAGDEKVLLNRFTTGRPPELIMGYLINNRPGSLVRLSELKREIDGVAEVGDLAETVRKIGFDKQLKQLFFKRCGTKELELTNPVETSVTEWEEIKQKRAP